MEARLEPQAAATRPKEQGREDLRGGDHKGRVGHCLAVDTEGVGDGGEHEGVHHVEAATLKLDTRRWRGGLPRRSVSPCLQPGEDIEDPEHGDLGGQ